MADKGISLRAFGKLVGVSGEYIRRAVEEGKIPAQFLQAGKVDAAGRKWVTIINPDAAAQAWRASRDPDYVRDKGALQEGAKRGWQQRRGQEPTEPADPGDELEEVPRAAPSATGTRGAELPTIAESRRKLAAVKTQTAVLELQEKSGRLVDAEKVKVRFIGMVASAKNRLLGIPTKAKRDIPTLTVRDIETLEGLIAEALEELALDGR